MLDIRKHISAYLIFIAVIIVVIMSCDIPFFSDMTYISSVANNIFENNFQSIINVKNDNGTPPLFSIFFASIWKIFGQSLIVSHLTILPFIFGIIIQFYHFAIRYTSKNATILALFLFLMDPTILTQTILMGYDIAIVFFFLLALNSIINKNKLLLIISTVFIALLNLRGFSIIIGLFLIDIYINKQLSIKSIVRLSIKYIASLIVLFSWFFYHYKVSGWFLISSSNISLHTSQGIIWIIKNLVFEIIALFSNGRVFILLFTVILLLYSIKKRKNIIWNNYFELINISFLSVIPYFLIFTSLGYPVGPRYFIFVYPFIYIIFTKAIEDSFILKNRLIAILISAIFLFSSNFWVNPYPYSNSWDSSLKGITYLRMQKELISFIKNEQIDDSNIYSSFPLHKNMKYSYLDKQYDINFNELDTHNLQQNDLVLFSNIYNNIYLSNPNIPIKKYKIVYEKYRNNVWVKLIKIED